jgi:DNA-directed RNA polymerase specialized sigma24 family protein
MCEKEMAPATPASAATVRPVNTWDLTQTTFTKLYRSWRRIERHDCLDQYAGRVLVRAFLDERRRPWRREYPTMPGSSALDTVAVEPPDSDERGPLDAVLVRTGAPATCAGPVPPPWIGCSATRAQGPAG